MLQQLVNGLMLGMTYALIGLGFTLVFGVLRILNIAHAQFIVATGFVAIFLYRYFDGNIFIVITGALAASALMGALTYLVAIRPLPRQSELGVFIATLGVAMVLEGGVAVAVDSRPLPFPQLLPAGGVSFETLGIRMTFIQMASVVVVLLLMLALWVLITRTDYGRRLRALAELPMMAEYMGVNVRRLTIGTIVLAAVLGGISAILWGALFGGIHPFAGWLLKVKGLTVMIVGGVGSIPGTLLAGLLLGIIEAMTATFFGAEFREASAFVLLALVLVVRPQGLMPSGASMVRA